ncbi:hypothetical protein FQA39_LY12348 [Lamprigera yunnana]|nr:hypothetical protein FQA39_LY12348 [Lamprigera yunnana]
MENWLKDKESNEDENFDNILVTHDLEDCIDESLDYSFNKVYEELPIGNYKEKPDTVFIENLQNEDENGGYLA